MCSKHHSSNKLVISEYVRCTFFKIKLFLTILQLGDFYLELHWDFQSWGGCS